jgi:excisionase family DNA binding protein
MNIREILDLGTTALLVVSPTDLKEFALSLISEREEEKKSNITAPETYLTQDEVAAKLQVDKSTLWRWDKSGYLNKCRVGGKVRYRLSDVTKLMEG